MSATRQRVAAEAPWRSGTAGPQRLPLESGGPHAFSVDVEDYFQVSLFEEAIERSNWSQLELRVEANTDRILGLLDRQSIEATFFMLGWVAERCPELVHRIQAAGHELALHGYDHQRITHQDVAGFRDDLRRAKAIVEDLTGEPVLGYRAPSYSVVRKTLWALEVLLEEGLRYDSSIFPIVHDQYGIPEAPRFPWAFTSGDDELIEFPASTVRLLRWNLPFVGGGYLRQFPMAYIEWGMRRAEREGLPVMLYVHPWELDPEQPRQSVGLLRGLRHYRNLSKTERRLERLCERFRFTSVRKVLGL